MALASASVEAAQHSKPKQRSCTRRKPTQERLLPYYSIANSFDNFSIVISRSADAKKTARYAQIEPAVAGQRLDNFLLASLRGVPRQHVYRLIRSGQVRVNSGRVAPSYRLKAGDRVRIPPVEVKRASEPHIRPADLAWLEQRILYEDSRLLVLDKPAGLAVHGGSRVGIGCIEALRRLRPDARELELAHRLDRATSGCLLIAKRRSTLRVLHALLREGRVEKRYLALVRGAWQRGEIEVDVSLVRAPRGAERLVRVGASGKEARTRFKLVQAFGARASLLEATLLTGRTHQIRVHAAHLGHPLAGDERYGDPEFNRRMREFGLQRMFLHAHSLGFRWPDSGEWFSIDAPLPTPLGAVLESLGEGFEAGGPQRRGEPDHR